MKLKDLIEKIDDTKVLFINGKQYETNLSKNILEREIIKINIEIKDTSGESLESLGYSFEVGVWSYVFCV